MGKKGFLDPDNQSSPRHPDSYIDLDFKKKNSPFPQKKTWAFGENVSALAIAGSTLFCATDETVSVERLVLSNDGTRFSEHESIRLADFFDFEDDSESEVDLEGLAIEDGYLWLASSHSLKRSEPKAGQDVSSLASMVSWDGKRGFLARIPMVKDMSGVFELKKAAGNRTAAMVAPGDGRDEGLRGLLSQEGLLHPFMNIPSKENGFDVEGLAVAGERLFLGLRGPVIASFALIVELHIKEEDGILVPQKMGERRYRLHAANLGGLGVRDLLVDEGRLLVLSGTSQKAESIQRVFAIKLDALSAIGGVLGEDDVELLLTLPMGGWGDHAEGMTLLNGKPRRLLIAYDSPAEGRLDVSRDRLTADIFSLSAGDKTVTVSRE